MSEMCEEDRRLVERLKSEAKQMRHKGYIFAANDCDSAAARIESLATHAAGAGESGLTKYRQLCANCSGANQRVLMVAFGTDRTRDLMSTGGPFYRADQVDAMLARQPVPCGRCGEKLHKGSLVGFVMTCPHGKRLGAEVIALGYSQSPVQFDMVEGWLREGLDVRRVTEPVSLETCGQCCPTLAANNPPAAEGGSTP